MIILKNYPIVKEIFNSLTTGIVIIDSDLKVIYANAAVEKITGTESSLMLNKIATDIFQGLDPDALQSGAFSGKVKFRTNSVNVICKAFKKYRILYLT